MQCKICGNIVEGEFCPICAQVGQSSNADLHIEQLNDSKESISQNDSTKAEDSKSCGENGQELSADETICTDESTQSVENGIEAEDCKPQNGESFCPETWQKCKEMAVSPEMQQRYRQAGTIDANVLSGIKNDLGMHDIAVSMCNAENITHPCDQHRQPKEALRAIANKLCPDCGKPFINESFCRCCGAPVTVEHYQED